MINRPCEWIKGVDTCQASNGQRAESVHRVKGIRLCAYHSPYDVTPANAETYPVDVSAAPRYASVGDLDGDDPYCNRQAQPEPGSVSEEGFIVRTVTSVDVPGKGTVALSSTVAEDERSLFRHVDAFRRSTSAKPVTSGFGLHDCDSPTCHSHYRWTWETLSEDGTRSTDTVWASRV
jgi:hypothetical protein